MPVTIYHNPQCAKSRATLKLLEDRGLKPNVIEYLKTPPSTTELKKLIGMLGITPRALLRTKEAEYKQLKLDNPSASDAQILHAMAKHPRLIERPIVVSGNRAALGRPPEQVLNIF
ncbi:MAG: arsenate reductase (glutaredoxin) [Gammaproteobacteria bacterium]|nr:arsenate reductase (glutaredoxin) [Gammaproteobacteria bacterium]